MRLPEFVKKALVISGLATGLSAVPGLAAEQKRNPPVKTPDAIVDVSKLPKEFDSQSGKLVKRLTPSIMEAADKVCHSKHLFLDDSVIVEAADVGHSVTTTVRCSDAHSSAHQPAAPRKVR